jgi:TolA-binding protein
MAEESKKSVQADPATVHVGHVEEVADFLKKFGPSVAVGASAALLVYVGIHIYRGYRADLGERASMELVVADDASAFQAIVDQYADTSSAPAAMLGVGAENFAEGNYDAAFEAYTAFQNQYPDHPMVPAAQICKAQCRESDGRLDEAVDIIEAFIAESEGSYLIPIALMTKARCLEQAKDWTGARTSYEDLIVGYAETPWATQGEGHLKLLNQKERAAQKP